MFIFRLKQEKAVQVVWWVEIKMPAYFKFFVFIVRKQVSRVILIGRYNQP